MNKLSPETQVSASETLNSPVEEVSPNESVFVVPPNTQRIYLDPEEQDLIFDPTVRTDCLEISLETFVETFPSCIVIRWPPHFIPRDDMTKTIQAWAIAIPDKQPLKNYHQVVAERTFTLITHQSLTSSTQEKAALLAHSVTDRKEVNAALTSMMRRMIASAVIFQSVAMVDAESFFLQNLTLLSLIVMFLICVEGVAFNDRNYGVITNSADKLAAEGLHVMLQVDNDEQRVLVMDKTLPLLSLKITYSSEHAHNNTTTLTGH